ncbi:MAG: FAD-dependent thymidylate synthase, partial [Solirubrobacterales bacterium]
QRPEQVLPLRCVECLDPGPRLGFGDPGSLEQAGGEDLVLGPPDFDQLDRGSGIAVFGPIEPQSRHPLLGRFPPLGQVLDPLAPAVRPVDPGDEAETRARIEALDASEREDLFRALVGERRNRRHRPGRGFEAASYRFEIVSDYGAFRDLQRHRILTCQWQALTPDLGAWIPEEVDEAGVGEGYREALELARVEVARLTEGGFDHLAPYALCLGYRIRYVLDLNAREAMQLIELRSGREGHPTYRAVAIAMRDAIAAEHPSIAASMEFVDDSEEERLERILSEVRTHETPVAAGTTTAPPGFRTLG